MAKKEANFEECKGNSPDNKGWKGSVSGLKNIAKTGSLYKQEMKDDTKKGGKFPKQDTPFIASNEPPDHE